MFERPSFNDRTPEPIIPNTAELLEILLILITRPPIFPETALRKSPLRLNIGEAPRNPLASLSNIVEGCNPAQRPLTFLSESPTRTMLPCRRYYSVTGNRHMIAGRR